MAETFNPSGYLVIDRVAASIDTLVSIPPLSWLDRALRGPVGPPK